MKMKWIIDDLKSAWAELHRGATWLVITLLAVFGLLAFIVGQFALRTDSVLRYLRLSVNGCRELTNGPIIFLFCGMMFFLFSVVITFGEIQRYYYFRDRNSPFEARRAAIQGGCWGMVAITISIGGLVFFNVNCW